MLTIILVLITIFLIATIGFIAYNKKSDAQYAPVTTQPAPAESTPIFTEPTQPVTTQPAPVEPTQTTESVPRLTSTIIDGQDFTCPSGYYYDGNSSYQKCIKDSSVDYTCPSGWNKVTNMPYCTFAEDTPGESLPSATPIPAIEPQPPINDQSSTPAMDTVVAPEPASLPEPVPAPVPEPVIVKPPPNIDGLCPFNTCADFDNDGNCVKFLEQYYRCNYKEVITYPDMNGQTIMETTDTPILKNARKMCYQDSNGNLLQRNGKYVCKFVKGGIVPTRTYDATYMNIYDDDMVGGYVVNSVSDIPIQPIPLLIIKRTSPNIAYGIIRETDRLYTGYEKVDTLLAYTDSNSFQYLGTTDYVDLYYVYTKKQIDGLYTYILVQFNWKKPTGTETPRFPPTLMYPSPGSFRFMFALPKGRLNKYCVDTLTTPYTRQTYNSTITNFLGCSTSGIREIYI